MDFFRFKPLLYREKTLHLTPYQDGCYRRLIDEYMISRKPLPDNDNALARICGVSVNDPLFQDAIGMLRAYFKHKNGLLYHDYCDAELDFQDNNARFLSTRAKNAAEKRWAKNKDLNATSIPQAMLGDARYEIRDISSKEDTPLLFPRAENSKPETKEKSNGTGSRKKPAIDRPKDWQPNINALAKCNALGIDAEREREKFCNYHDARGSKFSDWDAAFRNWITNAAEFRARDAAREANQRQGTSSVVRAGMQVASRYREKT